VISEKPLTVLAEVAHPDVSWGKVSFIATSTGDDNAGQSIAHILEQACADNLCTKKRTPPYQLKRGKDPHVAPCEESTIWDTPDRSYS